MWYLNTVLPGVLLGLCTEFSNLIKSNMRVNVLRIWGLTFSFNACYVEDNRMIRDTQEATKPYQYLYSRQTKM
jgi:hypothetical protein